MRFGQLYKIRSAEREAAKRRRGETRKADRRGVTSEHGIEKAYVFGDRHHRRRIEALNQVR